MFLLGCQGPTWNQSAKTMSGEKPEVLDGVGVTTKIGDTLPSNIELINEDGESVTLQDYLKPGRPLLFSVVYYNCPSLCNLHMNSVGGALEDLSFEAGKDFDWVLLSMDHKEGPELAVKKKNAYIKNFEKAKGKEKGWHFLTGTEANVAALTSKLGFGFKWNASMKEYAHASVVYVVTPEGKVSQMLKGLDFGARDFRLSLIQASKGKLGDFLDQALMFCYRFDPNKNKYTLYAFNIMRAGGAFTLLVLLILLSPIWIKEYQHSRGKPRKEKG